MFLCFILSFCYTTYHIPPFQSALGWDHQSELSKHESQTDAKKGFGGQFGVQKDRQDQVKTRIYMCIAYQLRYRLQKLLTQTTHSETSPIPGMSLRLEFGVG